MSVFEALHAGTGQPSAELLSQSGYRREFYIFAGIALSEIVLLSAYLAGSISGFTLMIQYFLVCLIVVALIGDQSGENENAAMVSIAGIATIVGGPIGAIGAAMLFLKERKEGGSTQPDEAWRTHLSGRESEDKSEVFFNEVCDGRTVDRASGVVVALEQVLRSGTLLDKQAALATIATHYGTEFRTVLFEAIRDPSPPVRVQAAAVLTKLRNHERHKFHALMGSPSAGIVESRRDIGVARDLIALIQRDFLDRKQRAQVEEVLDALLGRLADGRQGDDAVCLKRCRKLVDARFFEHAILLLDSIARGRRAA